MNCGLIIDGALNVAGVSVNGAVGVTGQITSSLATGTAPLNVTSTTVCTNLNADKLDGYDASSFLQTANQYITSVTSPLQVASHVLSILQANSSQSGYLSSGDWNTFSNKQNAITTSTDLVLNSVKSYSGAGAFKASDSAHDYLVMSYDSNYAYLTAHYRPLYIGVDSGQNVIVNATGLCNSAGYQMLQANATDWLRINQNQSFPSGVACYGNWCFGTGTVRIGDWNNASNRLEVVGNAYATGNLIAGGSIIVNGCSSSLYWSGDSSLLRVGGSGNLEVEQNLWCNSLAVGSLLGVTSSGVSISGNSEIRWNTYATSDWTNLGGMFFYNTYNGMGIEFKGAAHDFGNGVLYPVLNTLFYNNGVYTTMHEFDMNGDIKYAGSLIHYDSIDDIAAIRAMKSKKEDSGTLIHDPATLKFLQDDRGLFSLSACIGWELSVQQKFLAKHDEHEANIADLLKRIEALDAEIDELKAKLAAA